MAHIITKPEVEIAPKLLEEIKRQVHEAGQVIVHCLYVSISGGDGIRIWPSTYLLDHHSDHISELVHAEKISLFPVWSLAQIGLNHFTLIFSGLPKACIVFDLFEECNGAIGAFRVNNIKRTKEDIYYVRIS